ncbi:MAG TPA: hypothetical protein VNL14_16865 [Candidatus Acidoferrales bacterium]|nr:hypothetical protein [Candidatus Acidoferrales bacterium]
MAEHSQAPSPRDNPAVRHELSDANVRGIMLFGLWLALVALVIHVAVWVLYRYLERPALPSPAARRPEIVRPAPGKPQLQVEPQSELAQLRAHEQHILESYGWVDREKGIVRVPIQRAMEMIARDALPAANKLRTHPARAEKKDKEAEPSK